MIDRIVLAVFTIFLIPGLLFCWKGIWLYFKFYFLKFPLAYIIHLITLPLAFWFFIHYKASQNDKFNFLQGIFLSFGFLYVIAFSFIYIKGILLECKYSSKEPKNKDTKKQSNDENLFFKYDEKWANYFKEIIDFDEGNTSKFFLDSPQGSGKTTFINNLKYIIDDKLIDCITIDINTAEFDQEEKPLFLIVQKILEAKAVSKGDYIKLEFLTWKGSLSFLSNTWSNEPNDNVMKILAVFSDEDFKWQKKLFVFIDELDRCEGKYLLDFLAFSNEIFVKGKKKTINNIKIIYLVDQIAGFYRAYHYPQAVPPYGAIERDISTYKKYFEKYWEETFDLKFYVHNIFERINKFKTFSQRKIQSINLKGKKLSKFLQVNFSSKFYNPFPGNDNSISFFDKKPLNIRRIVRGISKKNHKSFQDFIFWLVKNHHNNFPWVHSINFDFSFKKILNKSGNLVDSTKEAQIKQQYSEILENQLKKAYYLIYIFAFILDFEDFKKSIKKLSDVIDMMIKKTSNIELSQLEYSELDFNAYLNSIFSNTTRVLNQMKTNNEYIFDNANDPFILNILLFLKEKKFFPEESGEFQINYSYNQRGNFGNICRFMYSINIKLNLSKSFRLSKNVKLKNHNLDKWFNNLIKALNKEFYKYLKMEHLNFFEDIVKNSVLKCSKKDYEKIFKFIIIKWRLNNFMGNFDWFKDILKVTPNFKDFKSNLKKENKKFFDQKISTIPQIKIEKFIKENWPIVQIDDLFNNINSFLSNHLNDENMEKYWLEKFKTRWNNIKIEISQKVNKINGKINKKTILEIEKIINQEIDLFKERFQLSYCNLYYELKKLEV